MKAGNLRHSSTSLSANCPPMARIDLKDLPCIDTMPPEADVTRTQPGIIWWMNGRGMKRSTVYCTELKLNGQAFFGTPILED